VGGVLCGESRGPPGDGRPQRIERFGSGPVECAQTGDDDRHVIERRRRLFRQVAAEPTQGISLAAGAVVKRDERGQP
jgi:hypothetical protein